MNVPCPTQPSVSSESSKVVSLRSPGRHRLVLDGRRWLWLGLLEPLSDVVGSTQAEVLAQLAQGREGVGGVVRGLGEDGGHGGREPGHGHRGHRREVQVLGLVGRRNVELSWLEV